MGKEKAIEICKNLNRTIKKMNIRNFIGNSILSDRNIWASTRASKSMLQKKVDKLIKEHKLNKKEL